jgi:carbamate kinase
MRIVAALGGNALMRPGERPSAAVQRSNLRRAAGAIAALARKHALVVTHGNGPQIGWLALQAEAATGGRPDPLDVLGAESEALVGYLIEQELGALLPDRELATLLTQVEVDPADPAFGAPTKPIGPLYTTRERADAVAGERDWRMAAVPGGFRRVVASPEPRRVRELGAIRRLVEAGVLVICAGGGGIPVVVTPGGGLRGVEAVIDKDLTTALLAEALGADHLLLLTDVESVYADWPGTAEPIRRADPAALRAHRFAPGSMGPKVEAACRFAERSGGVATIGALCDAERLLGGAAGTRIEGGAALSRSV